MRKSLIILILIIVQISPLFAQETDNDQGAYGYQPSFEATDSWVYESFNIIDHYRLPGFFVTSRPFLRGNLLEILKNNSLNSWQNPVLKWESDRIEKELSSIFYKTSPTNLSVRYKISPYSINQFQDDTKPLFRFGLKAEAVVSFGNHAFIQMRGRIENKAELDSYAKVRKWKDKLSGYFDYAQLGYHHKNLLLTFGRTFRSWGPRDNDRLLISTNSPAFNQFSLEYQNNWLFFQFWTARLDHFNGPDSTRLNRFISAHRLAIKPHKRLEIGFSETVLYARANSGLEWYYLNPILPYYWEQYNNRIDDNIYWQLDFIWYAREGLKIWGELLIDDFQIDFVSEPHQIGFNLGVSELGLIFSKYLQLELDYTQIRNTVYGQNKFYNVFANQGVVIGSSLGTDSDRFRYVATAHIASYLRLKAGGSISRKGEGRFDDSDSYPAPKGEKFPSGVVQTSYDHYLRAEILKDNFIESDLTIGYLSISNLYNTAQDYKSPYIFINIAVHLSKLHYLKTMLL